jgi:hypothetical protein
MACELTQGFLKGCRDSSGGTLEFYFANRPTTFTTTLGASGISAYTGTPAWYKYVPRKQTSSFTTTPTPSEENGTVFYESTIQVILTKMEQSKQNEIKLLAQADLLIIAKSQNGKYWLFGEVNGASMVASPGGSGTAYGDRNGYELNFTASEPNPTNEILYSAFSADIEG